MCAEFTQKRQLVEEFEAVCEETRNAVTVGNIDQVTALNRITILEEILHRFNIVVSVLEGKYERWNMLDQLVRLRIEKDKIHEEFGRVRDLVRWSVLGINSSFTENPSSGVPVHPDSTDREITRDKSTDRRELLEKINVLRNEISRLEVTITNLDKAESQITERPERVEQPEKKVTFPDTPDIGGLSFTPMIHSTPFNASKPPVEPPPPLPRPPAIPPRRKLSDVPTPKEASLIDLMDMDIPKIPTDPLTPSKKTIEVCPVTSEPSTLPPMYDQLQYKNIPVLAEIKKEPLQVKREPQDSGISFYGADNPVKFITKVPIPKFGGNKKEFQDWWAAFSACIDIEEVPPAVRMLKLKECLVDEAKACISGLGFTEEAFKVAKSRLERKFGGSRRRLAMICDELNSFKQIREKNGQDMEKFGELLDRLVVNLEECGDTAELGGGFMYSGLLKKLTPTVASQYNRWLYEHNKETTVLNLKEFINREAEFLIAASESVLGFQSEKKVRPKVQGSHTMTSQAEGGARKKDAFKTFPKQVRVCKNCNIKDHGIWECRKFKALSVDERNARRKELRLCFKCLGAHPENSCWRKRSCAVPSCRKPHHELLHGLGEETKQKTGGESKGGKASGAETGNMTGLNTEPLTHTSTSEDIEVVGDTFVSFRTVPVFLCWEGRRVRVNALLDEASNRSYLSEAVANHLRLQGQRADITVRGVASASRCKDILEVTCELESDDRSIKTIINALTLPKVAEGVRVKCLNKLSEGWPHLKGIVFPRPAGRAIELLLGLDHLHLIHSKSDVPGLEGQPVARLTPLGWTCAGDWTVRGEIFTFTCTTERKDMEIKQIITKIWELEEPKVESVYTPLEQKAVNIVEKSCEKINGRFCVGLPWKDGRPSDTNNYEQAVKRLISTENRVEKCGVQKEYQKVFDDYLDSDIVGKVDRSILKNKNILFLHHFPIIRLSATTTKVRPVYDGGSKYKGVSLNDFLLAGPKLQRCLVDVMLGFRRNAIAVLSDVEKMYLQILMKLEDQDFHLFLWRNLRREEEPQIYKFKRLVFGGSASPFVAQYIARKNASEYADKYPRAAKMILERTFMDDGLDSVHTVEEGINLIKEVSWIWAQASMGVHKWISNSPEVLESVPVEKRGTTVDLTRHELPKTKALGSGYDPQSDELCYNTDKAGTDLPGTKREYLKVLATVFDPLGLVSPVVVRGKMLLQKCWLTTKDWDDRLPDELIHEISEWIQDVRDLVKIRVPRVLVPAADYELYLHMMSDSSEGALGAVVYSVAVRPDTVFINLVASKSRVTPLSSVSVPRLELQAALVGSRLVDKVRAALDVEEGNCYCWTDSMDVLYWLQSLSREYKAYVQNRAAEIQRLTPPHLWRHIPTKENPADILSRGATTAELQESRLWMKGPEFLSKGMDEWPTTPEVVAPKNDKERRKNAVFTMVAKCGEKYVDQTVHTLDLENTRLDPQHWSKYMRLLRAIACLTRVVRKLRHKELLEGEYTAQELNDARIVLIRDAQRRYYGEELKCLLECREIPLKSTVKSMKPWLDEDGIIRGNTRISRSDEAPWEVKYPILLPGEAGLTTLLIRYQHEKNAHCGPAAVFTELLQEFWIERGREKVRRVLLDCYTCKKWSGKPYQPEMAPLPRERVGMVSRPFTVSSLDFAGPFYTKAGRGKAQNKRYLCVYGCMHTRAVHLEMVHHMTAQSFLLALTRILGKRGRPKITYSDNGTNMVGGVNILKEFDAILVDPTVQQRIAEWQIDWRYNPPAAPHFNGVHEVLVRSAKRALYKVLGTASMTDEEFQTACSEVERILNNRPLTYQSTDPRDDRALTPNHFLIGSIGYGPVDDDVADTGTQTKLRWQHVQHMVSQVWRRWMREWLTSLSPRKKWLKADRDLRVDDVVLVMEPNTARGRWPLGRVTKVFPGEDGVVRVIEVETRGIILRRPAVKVCRLVD